ncbi:hypothetical protein BDV30DRAFT_235597 [Aspergillus minisclerotigenes]|uniref:Uncharacterized protein n=1 Tax=Aspergillus minisclerotigenes TaxID=656917 RepID=A0A5N6JCH2_9EURO|nr:hypothetical protein BDV30DRAFT_235597 [Aspergillus minisclerotigenes]
MGTSLFIIDDICQARKSRQSLSPLEKDKMDTFSALYGRYDPRKVSSQRRAMERILDTNMVAVGMCPQMRPDPMETGRDQEDEILFDDESHMECGSEDSGEYDSDSEYWNGNNE